mmetsp:Transcript_8395/g.23084  ORF Transcript_8395/g.23084 Transcript_8395/m.23084 type:complete len:778 (+) Transcript_8395:71-2404(+)
MAGPENGTQQQADAAQAAANARACFAAGDYAGARSQLEAVPGGDLKRQHNLALANYYASGCANPQGLISALEGLKKAGGESELAADASLSQYNAAVAQFQLQQYGKCRAVLEALFLNIEPVDEFLAFRVCFLLLEVCLVQRDAHLGMKVLTFLDRSYAALTKSGSSKASDSKVGAAAGGGGGTGDTKEANGGGDRDGSGAGGQGSRADGSDSGGVGADAKAAGASEEWPGKRSSRPSPVSVGAAEVAYGLRVGRARLYLLLNSLQLCKREIKAALSVSSVHPAGIFLKAQLEFSRGNARKALRALHHAMHTAGTSASQQVVAAGVELNLPALYYNDLGCVHYSMKKYAAAAFYFDRALGENEVVCKVKAGAGSPVVQPFACDRSCEMLYNKGLQLLLLGQPASAFGPLQRSLRKLYAWPRVWMRLGECCVALHCLKAGAEAAAEVAADEQAGLGAVASAVGTRRILLPTGRGGAASGSAWPMQGEAGSADMLALTSGSELPGPAPTLEYGALCFRNALAAEPKRAQQVVVDEAAAASADGPDAGDGDGDLDDSPALQAAPGAGVHGGRDAEQAQAAPLQHLARLNLAWVCLELGDPLGALSALGGFIEGSTPGQAAPGGTAAADKEVGPSLPAPSPMLSATAVCYIAEALISLGRVDEALEQLAPTSMADLFSRTALDEESGAPGEDLSCISSFPRTSAQATLLSTAARCALATNTATAYLARDDLAAAEQCVQQALALNAYAREPLLLRVYLDLRNGNHAGALSILRSGRTIPTSG